ncbi:MAG TPA: hypothetical protein VF269_03095 [Rhodanobacteraceae bacterium]
MLNRPNTWLGVYALVLTAAFGALLLMGAKSAPANASFGTLNVQRINVREPDGTLRMVISDKARFPGWIIHGKAYPHPRPRAGMLFYNDEGTEQGGLIFSGHKTGKTSYASGLSLTFDRYDQNQQLQLVGLDSNGHYFSGLRVNDVPHAPFLDEIEAGKKINAMPKGKARAAAIKRFHARFAGSASRFFAGRSASGNSVVMLRDAKGRPRLALMVTPDGKASIEFLDAHGKVVRKLTGDDLAKVTK